MNVLPIFPVHDGDDIKYMARKACHEENVFLPANALIVMEYNLDGDYAEYRILWSDAGRSVITPVNMASMNYHDFISSPDIGIDTYKNKMIMQDN